MIELNRNIIKKIQFLLLCISFIVLYFVIKDTSFVSFSPDSKIYFNSAMNINRGWYCETVNTEEILPSVGHPFLISLFLRLGIEECFPYFFYTTSLILFLVTCKIVLRSILIPLLCFILFFTFYKFQFIKFGVELTMLFSSLLFWLNLLLLYKNRHNEKKMKFFLFGLAFTIFLFIMIRPLLLPLVVFIALVLLFFYKRIKMYFIYPYIVLLIFLLSVFVFSKIKYQDTRLLTGTYGAITLYSAFNEYINLEEIYSPENFKVLKKDEYEKVFGVIKNYNGWENRNKRLKSKVFTFILNHPKKAIRGYLWRLSMYTWKGKMMVYKVMFWIYLFLFFISIIRFRVNKEKFYWIFICFFITLYIICLQAVFPFVGYRYYLMPFVFIVLSILSAIQIFIDEFLEYCSNKKVNFIDFN